jgi:predicted NAD/FAD-binding protein
VTIAYDELRFTSLSVSSSTTSKIIRISPALFDHLGVESVESSMIFAVTADQGRFEWRGAGENWLETAKGLFAQRRNMLSTSYLWMLRDILTFNQKSASRTTRPAALAGLSLGEYFRPNHFAPRLLTDYLAPMGAAIWSAPDSEIPDFPAENFVTFFSNHRLLQYDRPVWRTVKGGSHFIGKRCGSGSRAQGWLPVPIPQLRTPIVAWRTAKAGFISHKR